MSTRPRLGRWPAGHHVAPRSSTRAHAHATAASLTRLWPRRKRQGCSSMEGGFACRAGVAREATRARCCRESDETLAPSKATRAQQRAGQLEGGRWEGRTDCRAENRRAGGAHRCSESKETQVPSKATRTQPGGGEDGLRTARSSRSSRSSRVSRVSRALRAAGSLNRRE